MVVVREQGVTARRRLRRADAHKPQPCHLPYMAISYQTPLFILALKHLRRLDDSAALPAPPLSAQSDLRTPPHICVANCFISMRFTRAQVWLLVTHGHSAQRHNETEYLGVVFSAGYNGLVCTTCDERRVCKNSYICRT